MLKTVVIAAMLLAGAAQARGLPAGLPDGPPATATFSAGTAEMARDGTIRLHGREAGMDAKIHPVEMAFAPSDPQYATVKTHLSQLKPGGKVPLPMWVLESAQNPPPVDSDDPDADYKAFKALAGPYRLDDMVAALSSAGLTKAERTALRPVFVAALAADDAAVADPVMRPAYEGFSHDEVIELMLILRKPGIARAQDVLVQGMWNSGGGGPDANGLYAPTGASVIVTDGEDPAMSQGDRDLIDRFRQAVLNHLPAAMPGAAQVMARLRVGPK